MKHPYLLVLASIAVAASTGFSQTSVPIVDPSFESGPTGEGAVPTGWTASGNGNPSFIISDFGPGGASVTGTDGNDEVELFNWNGNSVGAGAIGSVATSLSQTLTTDFIAGDTYTLTALGANTAGQAAITGGYFFITSSAAPFTSTATVDATASFTGTTSTFKTFSITYTPTVADVGLPIQVGFYAPGQPASGSQTVAEIDDFVLTATSVPEPSSIAIAALGGFGLLGLVRRRRA